MACIAQKVAVASQIPFFYLGKLLVPLRLMPEYVVQLSDRLASPETLSALAGLLVISLAALLLRRRQPLILFGIGWYLLTMVPVLHIFPTYPIVADRYAYLPSFGLALCLATAGASWAGSPNRQRTVNLVARILVTVLALLTLQQNRIWHSGETLWQYTMQTSPRSVKAYTNLGRIYFSAGRYAEAFTLFDQARQLEPSDPHYDFFEGMLYFVRSDFAQALPHFQRALFRADGFLEALFHAGMAHDALGNRDQAIAFFTKTVQSKQDDLGGFRALARGHLQRLQ
jgi:tetratricopeptide (TPR) repeat protein